MLKSLHIKNFRGFRDLQIDSLKRVNLLTGQNNTGKTGVLEALVLLLSEPESNQRQLLPNLFRPVGGDWNENYWKWLFNNRKLENNLEIKVSFDNRDDFSVILQPDPQIPIDYDSALLRPFGQLGHINCYGVGYRQPIKSKPAIFSTKPSDPVQDAIDFNRVVLKKRNKQVEELLRQIEPRLETLQPLQFGQFGQPPQPSTPLIYAGISGLSEMIPVTQLGQGFNRLLDIYSELVVADAKVLLIDEIENGLHYSVLPLVWKGLFLAAKEFDVQIFATTHSWECILEADKAAREWEPYELELIRLDRVNEDIKATIIDQGALATAKELKWEMR
jgi:hypothetical protein